MKKVWAVLLAAALLLAMAAPVMADGEEFVIKDGVLVQYNGPGGDVVIPDGVTEIGRGVFSENPHLTSVSISDGVTTIGTFAFGSCANLKTVIFPNSLIKIENRAFIACGIESITIPESVTVIEKEAFSDCDLTSITIPEGVTSVGDYAFSSCQSLTSASIPESLVSIGRGVFSGCKLTEVTLPANMTSFGKLFLGCGLEDFTIPYGITTIENEAFRYCTDLKSISIPDSVTNIGGYAFENCSSLTSVTIPDSVTMIDGGAFKDCSSLTSVLIPDSVTSIGDEAFRGCSSLTNVTIPDSVIQVGLSAFYGTPLYTRQIEDQEEYICLDHVLLSYNGPGGDLIIPDGIRVMADSIFQMSGGTFRPAIGSVTLPNSLIRISDGAFADSSLTSIDLPDGLTSIGMGAFQHCGLLESIEIPDSVTNIGSAAFMWSGLKNVTLSNSLTTIEDHTFYVCLSLIRVTIPESVETIGESAFELCNSLTDVYYGGTQQQWDAVSIAAGNDPLLNAAIHFADPAPAHTHTLTHHAACPADCTQDGSMEYWSCADCGRYFADEEARQELSADDLILPALGHDWGAWVRVKEPTETAYGRKTRTCARCGATESVLIQMLPSVTPETPTQPPQTEPEPHAFADVPETEWYVEAVNYAWNKGLMKGVSETEFAPDATADRVMLVTILHRMAEEPEAAAAAFADVDADAWFAAAVAWASEAGVVSGYEDGLFHPNQPITREQLVTMLWRMAGKPAAEPVETGAADWAAEAMSWAVGSGVILGDGSGYSPRRTATRAEVAAILMRCDQL